MAVKTSDDEDEKDESAVASDPILEKALEVLHNPAEAKKAA